MDRGVKAQVSKERSRNHRYAALQSAWQASASAALPAACQPVQLRQATTSKEQEQHTINAVEQLQEARKGMERS